MKRAIKQRARLPVSRSGQQETAQGNDRPARVYGERQESKGDPRSELQDLDSGIEAYGILEVMPDGFGFIRCGFPSWRKRRLRGSLPDPAV